MGVLKQNSKYIYFQIKPFKDNELGINHREVILRNLLSLKKNIVSFFITGNMESIKIFAKIPKTAKTYFSNSFYSNFETSDLILVSHRMKIFQKKIENIQANTFIHYKLKENILNKESFTKDGNYIDPMKDILSLFSNLSADINLTIFFDIKFQSSLNILKNIFFVKKNTQEEEIQDKKEIFLSIGYNLDCLDKYTYESIKKNIISSFATFAPGNKVQSKNSKKYINISISQVVNFFHIPTKENFIKGLDYNIYRRLAYPSNIPTINNTENTEITILGKSDYRGDSIDFGIKKEDKFRHIYIVGKTGTGKSTLMSNMVKSDMINGNGLCLLDPHGDLVDTVIEHIPKNRINDVILFDISDSEYPIGFNLLQYKNEDEKNRIVSGVVSTFYKLFEHSRGPRLEYILRNVLLTIVDYPNATLMHILRILVDKDFRQEVLTYVTDSMILKFWKNEFDKRQDRQREEAIGPITNKIGQFLSSKVVRNIFGQPRTKLSLRKVMDEGKIILINLSKGKIGEDNASMIGSLLVTKIQIDAMSRADIPYNQRKNFYLYIDEFQNFATKSFATILSEARKYKLSLIVANQFTAQLLDDVKDAIFGNVGTIISFSLGHDDATIISNQYKELVSINDLISLPRFTAYTKLMIDGVTSDPFSMKTKPLLSPFESEILIEKIKKQSRQRYAMKRQELEKLLEAWGKKSFTLQEKISQKAKLEGLGVTEQEYKNLQNPIIQNKQHLFTDFSINGEEPDAIIFDTKYFKHKAIRYKKPGNLDDEAVLKFKGGTTIKREKFPEIKIYVDIYQHKILKLNESLLMFWIGNKKNILHQLQEGYKGVDFLLFCPNIEKLLSKELIYSKTNQLNSNENLLPILDNDKKNSEKFTIKDIKLNNWYQGYVKLKYNYGLFITVKGIEGLLHKKFIIVPDNLSRKQYYNIGDKIRIRAVSFKDIKGEKKVVRSQLQ